MTITPEYLAQFTGSEKFYRHITFRKFVYTEGVKYVAEEGQAYWLIDAILSWQGDPKIKNDIMLQRIQFWDLKVFDDNSATLSCLRDKNDIAITQKIEFTDFPLKNIQFYLSNNTLMLPSEY